MSLYSRVCTRSLLRDLRKCAGTTSKQAICGLPKTLGLFPLVINLACLTRNKSWAWKKLCVKSFNWKWEKSATPLNPRSPSDFTYFCGVRKFLALWRHQLCLRWAVPFFPKGSCDSTLTGKAPFFKENLFTLNGGQFRKSISRSLRSCER